MKQLKADIKRRKERAKPPRRIRYDSYVSWWLALKRKKIGMSDETDSPHYAYPPIVLSYIRNLVPGDIKGELRDDAFKVSLKHFCMALEMKKL